MRLRTHNFGPTAVSTRHAHSNMQLCTRVTSRGCKGAWLYVPCFTAHLHLRTQVLRRRACSVLTRGASSCPDFEFSVCDCVCMCVCVRVRARAHACACVRACRLVCVTAYVGCLPAFTPTSYIQYRRLSMCDVVPTPPIFTCCP